MNRRQTLRALSFAAIALPTASFAQTGERAAEDEHMRATLGRRKDLARNQPVSRSPRPPTRRSSASRSLNRRSRKRWRRFFAPRIDRSQAAQPKIDAEAKAAIDRVHAQQAGPAFDKVFL